MSAQPKQPVDWEALVQLFEPGSGVMPPELAGREDELKTLSRFRARLAEKRPPPSDIVLCGPRGNGKTVLLDAFGEQRGAQVPGPPVHVHALTPDDIKTKADLAAQLLPEDRGFGKFLKSLPRGLGLGALSFSVRLDWERMSAAERSECRRRHFAGLLAARCLAQGPLAVTLDEAHTLDIEVGRALLNASQMARRKGAPFLLVLAGTPGLEARLGEMDATFWSRSEVLGIGRLPAPGGPQAPDPAREALAEPLKDFGIGFDEAALSAVVEESQRYPYFVQVWGRALCEALAERKATRIDAEIVEAARPAFEARRTFYYEDRCKELRKHGLLAAAEAVAAEFAKAEEDEPRRTPRTLEDRLRAGREPALSEAEAAEELERLSHLGLVWQPPGEECMEAGIPSLMDHVGRKAAALGPGIGEERAPESPGLTAQP